MPSELTRRNVEIVSFSEIDAFRQCPFKHLLGYEERWVRKTKSGGALDKGVLWHAVLEAHYGAIQRGEPHLAQQEAEKVLQEAEATGTDLAVVDLVRWMYQGYLAQYGLDDDWKIVAVEHKMVVPLFDEHGHKTRFRLKVRIDLIVRDRNTGRLWIVDHKSHANLPNDKDLDFDVQFPMYVSVLQRLGKPVIGTIYNTARTKRNQGDVVDPDSPEWKKSYRQQSLEERFSRQLMNHPKPRLRSIEQEILRTVKLMKSAHNEHERHPNSDTCKWRCDFNEACLLGMHTGSDQRTRLMLAETGWQTDPARH